MQHNSNTTTGDPQFRLFTMYSAIYDIVAMSMTMFDRNDMSHRDHLQDLTAIKNIVGVRANALAQTLFVNPQNQENGEQESVHTSPIN